MFTSDLLDLRAAFVTRMQDTTYKYGLWFEVLLECGHLEYRGKRGCKDGKHNIKMDLREIGWNGVDWMDMAQDRDQWRALVDTVLNLRVP
jgi:hypothetical protein